MSNVQQVVFFDSRDKLQQSTTSITQPTPNNISLTARAFAATYLGCQSSRSVQCIRTKHQLWFRDSDWSWELQNDPVFKVLRDRRWDRLTKSAKEEREPFRRRRACSNLLQIGLFWETLALRWMLPCFAIEPTSAESSVWQVRKWSSSGFILPVDCMDEEARKTGFKLT